MALSQSRLRRRRPYHFDYLSNPMRFPGVLGAGTYQQTEKKTFLDIFGDDVSTLDLTELAALREQTSHGDRIDEAPSQGEQQNLVKDIIAELEAIDAGEKQKTINVWDGHLAAFIRALESNPEQMADVGHALQRQLDLEEEDVGRSEILRFALRLGFQKAAPEEFEAVREAARKQATKGL